MNEITIRHNDEVAAALETNQPIVALESTVFSNLGLPDGANEAAIVGSHAAVRDAGAVPAMTAVLDGEPYVGVDSAGWPRILSADRKVAARDLGVAIGQAWPAGVTTVSASVTLAAKVGIRVFATGGIGGVHRDHGLPRGAAISDDVSADLGAIATHPVVTVCAGAKSFLDLARTLERLETLSVPVLGYRTDAFPAFTSADSGLPVPYRIDSPAEIAAIATANREMTGGGILVAVPPPQPLDPAMLAEATLKAEAAAARDGITGAALTPFVLGKIAEATEGRSVEANIALVVNNARVAAEIAASAASE